MGGIAREQTGYNAKRNNVRSYFMSQNTSD
jgi:hypothetical protein